MTASLHWRAWQTLGLLTCCAASASAAQADFSASGVVKGGFPVLQASLNDLNWGGNTFGVGVSNRGLGLSYRRTLNVPPVGGGQLEATTDIAWKGGYRVGGRLEGSAGPLALTVGGQAFTVSARHFDPLADYAQAPTDPRDSGWQAEVGARYRVSRQWIAQVGGEWGATQQYTAGVEYRRDLVQYDSPPADEPGAKPIAERVGSWSGRLGTRLGSGLMAATAGSTYSTIRGLSVGVDGLVGSQTAKGLTWGLSASVSKADLLGENSAVKAYVAYEPWRVTTVPLRLGLEASKSIGPGTAQLAVRAGAPQLGTGGLSWGLKLGYSVMIF